MKWDSILAEEEITTNLRKHFIAMDVSATGH